ncbi:hypothetical protein H072_4678 [Dactylellina haptotyla CBS 200.50]|uniref:Uncharacterized protein n=1 Tax=Dactylellina haptotyla (strain CBS 200.50) TaxID=1284197 RepID=S8AEG9_DACHA|nr:hypothetical protein H072_4678 [Dactylellina haptotyla CBS 200.50]
MIDFNDDGSQFYSTVFNAVSDSFIVFIRGEGISDSIGVTQADDVTPITPLIKEGVRLLGLPARMRTAYTCACTGDAMGGMTATATVDESADMLRFANVYLIIV